MSREDLVTLTFVELANDLVDDFDVVELLTRLAGRCVELLPIASAGILLSDPRGILQFIAASDERAELLELFGLQHEDGPCLDSFRAGEVVANHDLSTAEPRWPRFAPAAAAVGYRAVYAMPMRVRDTTIGSLTLFREAPSGLPPPDVALAQALADVATVSIMQGRALHEANLLADQLGHALNSRVLIEQAKGMLAERCQIEVDAAFTHLRRHARDHRRRLSDVAAAIIDGSLSAADLTRVVEDA